MTDPVVDTTVPERTWPLFPGEHPDLPRLRSELHPGRPAETRGKRVTRAARAPYARYLFDTTRVIETGNPDRIRSHAAELLNLADALEHAHLETPADELFPEDGQ